MQQRGVPLLRDLYVRFETRSADYKYACDPTNREAIIEALALEPEHKEGDDVRVYSTRTYAHQNFTDQILEHPEILDKFRPKVPVPKPKGKDQKIDRMVKKAAKEKELKKKGTKKTNPNRLVNQVLEQGDSIENQISGSRDYVPTLGKSIEVFQKISEDKERRQERNTGSFEEKSLGYEGKELSTSIVEEGRPEEEMEEVEEGSSSDEFESQADELEGLEEMKGCDDSREDWRTTDGKRTTGGDTSKLDDDELERLLLDHDAVMFESSPWKMDWDASRPIPPTLCKNPNDQ